MDGGVVIYLGFLLLAGSIGWLGHRVSAARRERAARTLLDGLPRDVRVHVKPDAMGGIRIVATSLPSDFTLADTLLGHQQVDVGDSRLRIRGDTTTVLSCLTNEARGLLLDLLERHHVRVANGDLTVTTRATDRAEVSAVVQTVSNLARELTAMPPGPAALLRNAKRPSGDRAQHLNAVHLLSRFPASYEAMEWLGFARANRGVVGFTWSAAAELLGPDVHAFLATAFHPDVARAVRDAGTPIAERIVDRLAEHGQPGEAMLCAIIEAEPNDLLSNQALATLARTGSVAIVERLMKARSFGSFAAFEKAIKAIQDRAVKVEGGLSITETALRGALSETAPSGALSRDPADDD